MSDPYNWQHCSKHGETYEGNTKCPYCRIAGLEAKLAGVREITDEWEDTRLGSAAIRHGVTVIGSYLERLETALGDKDE